MSFRSLQVFRMLRQLNVKCSSIRVSSNIVRPEKIMFNKPKDFRTENNLTYFEDPDNFGTLSRKILQKNIPEDEGDIVEENRSLNIPLQSQKLTIKQYADLIKHYLNQKRLKEAIDVLEVKMLTEDQVKPVNYIYNILIGACAEVGYTKKAFKLFNDMKRRALKPTGDTYTCLFNACANSPWSEDGLKHAKHLKDLMIEKGIEPNITNYNAMIKCFGRCGELTTAFQLVDEMKSKKIKIRVHTLNNLLHACISDKEYGLKHALIIWRKMLKFREKPNIYSFNLMLKCVKDCNLGSLQDMQELMCIIRDTSMISPPKVKQVIENKPPDLTLIDDSNIRSLNADIVNNLNIVCQKQNDDAQQSFEQKTSITVIKNEDTIKIELLDKSHEKDEQRKVPNLLSKCPNMQEVLSLNEVKSAVDRFAIVGGLEDFLNEMEVYAVKPDIKTFTQILMVMEDTREAELKLLEKMKSLNVNADIDFFNMLIKKRCLRSDYQGAIDVKKMIAQEDEYRKKRYSMNKKYRIKLNIMTYGVLAMTCKTIEDAEKLLEEMKEKQLKVNIEILGALLKHGTVRYDFKYIQYVMNIVKKESIKPNQLFIKFLEDFNDKCIKSLKKKKMKSVGSEKFYQAHKQFVKNYEKWLKDVNAEAAIQSEHPWAQFRESQPETLQRQNLTIKVPKRFFKRKRIYKPYMPII